jgi:predicted ATPase/DNA-binding winged helix-turn-helix (wHTH) protein
VKPLPYFDSHYMSEPGCDATTQEEDMVGEGGVRSFAFGPFVLIPQRQSLLQDGAPVRIGGRALEILTALAERPGELISKRELVARVWPDTIVDDSNLKVNMAALRRALGDGGAHETRYIATVTGRGYRLIVPVTPGLAPDAAAVQAAAPARRHNLPTATTRIVGRADAIDAIRRDLDAARLVSIVGPGGVGKTTVALAVAGHAIGAFRDGVWLLDLASIDDPQLVPGAIAALLGVEGNTGLREREMLLVFDSCEHLIDAAAACACRILAEAAGVKILATSREPLQLKGERLRRLSGLESPPVAERLTAQHALLFPAVQLFVERATDRLDSFKLLDADAPAVAQLCRRLDGIALAIELAASRIDAFGVGGLLQQLDDRFGLLVGRRAGPERHRTLRATLGWSYRLLTEAEAALLCAVSMFAGRFDIDDAAAVASLTRAEAADMLARLAAKSLLVTDLAAGGIAYRLQETMHTYCRDRLRADGTEHGVRERHAACMYAWR